MFEMKLWMHVIATHLATPKYFRIYSNQDVNSRRRVRRSLSSTEVENTLFGIMAGPTRTNVCCVRCFFSFVFFCGYSFIWDSLRCWFRLLRVAMHRLTGVDVECVRDIRVSP